MKKEMLGVLIEKDKIHPIIIDEHGSYLMLPLSAPGDKNPWKEDSSLGFWKSLKKVYREWRGKK